jgi:hypothetical protein
MTARFALAKITRGGGSGGCLEAEGLTPKVTSSAAPERGDVKNLAIEGTGTPLTPGPSPRWGEGKVNIKFNSLAPAGGEGARRAGEGVVRTLLHLQGIFTGVIHAARRHHQE